MPFERIRSGGDEILLDCTRAEFLALEHADDAQREVLINVRGTHVVDHLAVHHRIPEDTVEVVAGTGIRATDGDVGYLKGLVVDPSTARIARALAVVGRFLSKKEIGIPIEMVRGVDAETMHLAFNKSAVLALR